MCGPERGPVADRADGGREVAGRRESWLDVAFRGVNYPRTARIYGRYRAAYVSEGTIENEGDERHEALGTRRIVADRGIAGSRIAEREAGDQRQMALAVRPKSTYRHTTPGCVVSMCPW